MEETLKYLFMSLQNIIPDVLEACSNDGEAAFEKLQQMQAFLCSIIPNQSLIYSCGTLAYTRSFLLALCVWFISLDSCLLRHQSGQHEDA